MQLPRAREPRSLQSLAEDAGLKPANDLGKIFFVLCKMFSACILRACNIRGDFRESMQNLRATSLKLSDPASADPTAPAPSVLSSSV